MEYLAETNEVKSWRTSLVLLNPLKRSSLIQQELHTASVQLAGDHNGLRFAQVEFGLPPKLVNNCPARRHLTEPMRPNGGIDLNRKLTQLPVSHPGANEELGIKAR